MIRYKQSTSALALFGALGLAACGKTADKVADTIEFQGRFQTAPRNELSVQANGIGCAVHEADVTAMNLAIKQTFYGKVDCTGEPLGQLVTEGSFSVGAELPIAPGARAMDYTVSKVVVTSHSAEWLKALNLDASGNCAIGDLPAGASREITGLDCGVLGKLPGKDQVFYTSFALNNDELKLTLPPNELIQHVGPANATIERAQDLKLVYIRK